MFTVEIKDQETKKEGYLWSLTFVLLSLSEAAATAATETTKAEAMESKAEVVEAKAASHASEGEGLCLRCC